MTRPHTHQAEGAAKAKDREREKLSNYGRRKRRSWEQKEIVKRYTYEVRMTKYESLKSLE